MTWHSVVCEATMTLLIFTTRKLNCVWDTDRQRDRGGKCHLSMCMKFLVTGYCAVDPELIEYSECYETVTFAESLQEETKVAKSP